MQLTLEIPDQYFQGKNQSQAAQQIKLYAALLMFQSGQLSRGAACEFADVYFERSSFQLFILYLGTQASRLP